MRHTILFLSILLATGLAHAREGFHMGLGGGFSSLNGDDAVRVSGLPRRLSKDLSGRRWRHASATGLQHHGLRCSRRTYPRGKPIA